MRLNRIRTQVGRTYGERGGYSLLHQATNLNLSYWRRKAEDSNFHPLEHGGKRTAKYTEHEQNQIELALWNLTKINPARTIQQFVNSLNNYLKFEEPVKWNYVQRLFKKWGWSFKVSAAIMVQKFSKENLDHWEAFVNFVLRTPKEKLKFLDESHFSSKNVYQRKAVGPKNVPIEIVNGKFIDVRYSVTLLTDLTKDIPVFYDIRRKSNTAADFVKFVSAAITFKYLQNGDFLVVDNAAVHSAAYIRSDLDKILKQAGVTLVYLPTYSPELNPCELVFGDSKKHIKFKENRCRKFEDNIHESLSFVSQEKLSNFYKKCKYCFNEKKCLVKPRVRVTIGISK